LVCVHLGVVLLCRLAGALPLLCLLTVTRRQSPPTGDLGSGRHGRSAGVNVGGTALPAIPCLCLLVSLSPCLPVSSFPPPAPLPSTVPQTARRRTAASRPSAAAVAHAAPPGSAARRPGRPPAPRSGRGRERPA